MIQIVKQFTLRLLNMTRPKESLKPNISYTIHPRTVLASETNQPRRLDELSGDMYARTHSNSSRVGTEGSIMGIWKGGATLWRMGLRHSIAGFRRSAGRIWYFGECKAIPPCAVQCLEKRRRLGKPLTQGHLCWIS